MRHALRTLAKNPGFAAVAILAIALGVGPNSAVFSIIHTVLLQPLPIGNANRVVIVWETNKAHRSEQIAVSPQDLLDWQRESHAFVAFSPGNGSPEYGFNLTGAGDPERVLAGRAGVNFTDIMGIPLVVGRGFTSEDGRPGAAPAALLSYQLWQRRFHGDPAIVGRS